MLAYTLNRKEKKRVLNSSCIYIYIYTYNMKKEIYLPLFYLAIHTDTGISESQRTATCWCNASATRGILLSGSWAQVIAGSAHVLP